MFESLRNMDSFTDDMFNRIIAFQEKEHPAWIAELPFDQRIKDLPLHYLIFSNGDRDPEKYGPTVAPYYPLQWEMQRFAHYVKHLGGDTRVWDVHAGNGFIGSLLAREGVTVTGLRDPDSKPNQIEDFFDPEHYQMQTASLDSLNSPCDVIFSSWMPANQNYTPEILKHKPKLVIFIYTDHIRQDTGLRQTGTADAFDLHHPYELIDEWSVTRQENLLREIWPDLTGNIEETRKIRIYGHRDHPFQKPAATQETRSDYDWEKELELVLLAHKAKELVKARGFPA